MANDPTCIAAGRYRLPLLFSATLSLAACGGGGETSPPPPPPVPGPAQATLVAPATGSTPWNIGTSAQITLTDTAGAPVAGALSCTSDAPSALSVAPDCSSLKGLRLGAQSITVSSGGVSAKVTVQVMPPAQPIGTNSNSLNYNLVAATDQRILGWGLNINGFNTPDELLHGMPLPRPVLQQDGSVLGSIVAVSAGDQAVLALANDGEVYSWGQGYTIGRPASHGDYRPTGSIYPGKVVDPSGTSTLQHIVAVSTGARNAVALADDGTVYSWGTYSFLTAGTPADMLPKALPLPGPAIAVATGPAWTAVLLADGRVMTFGSGSSIFNSLGRPIAVDNAPPDLGFVVDLQTGQPLTGIIAISAGDQHGLALDSAGHVHAWGDNTFGQLGQNLAQPACTAGAVMVKSADGTGLLSDIVSVAAGRNHSLALDASGRAVSWGLNTSGQLGDAGTHRGDQGNLPAFVIGSNGSPLQGIGAIGAGYNHSLALANDGRLLVWGAPSYNNLGQGGATGLDGHTPLPVLDEAGTAPLSLGPVSHWPDLWRQGGS